MNFAPCLLCDILSGVPTAGGILIDNNAWFAFHAPPEACARHVVVLAPKRHVLATRQLKRPDLALLHDLQRCLDAAFRIISPDRAVRVEMAPKRFGHFAWLVYAQENDQTTPMLERLAPTTDAEVRGWAADIEMALDEVRISQTGGRLPAPPRVPADAERRTVPVPGGRFCGRCGAKLVPADLERNRCHACEEPLE